MTYWAKQNTVNPIAHYNVVIMSAMPSQSTSVSIVCKSFFQAQIKTSKAPHRLGGGHSPHKGQVTQKMFPIMIFMGYAASAARYNPQRGNGICYLLHILKILVVINIASHNCWRRSDIWPLYMGAKWREMGCLCSGKQNAYQWGLCEDR